MVVFYKFTPQDIETNNTLFGGIRPPILVSEKHIIMQNTMALSKYFDCKTEPAQLTDALPLGQKTSAVGYRLMAFVWLYFSRIAFVTHSP